ncbi:MAG: hypothetical protein QG597_3874 [Actinomycetota bacterium]|nr:hypothetical protein [Actinomycetota bacterium]
MNPDAFAVPSIDPFRHPAVLEVAARITPQTWRQFGPHRGFARAAGAGRVPDVIRLRRTRGAQGLDVWHWMRHDHDRYVDEVEQLADTPAIADLVNIPALRSTIDTWLWGTPEPPPQIEMLQVNRVLGFAQFIRDTQQRLDSLPSPIQPD